MPPPRSSLWRDRALRFLTGAGSTIAAAVTGVIRNKWLALHLDTTGIGVLAQTASGQNWLGSLAGMGLNLPVARAVALRDQDVGGADYPKIGVRPMPANLWLCIAKKLLIMTKTKTAVRPGNGRK